MCVNTITKTISKGDAMKRKTVIAAVTCLTMGALAFVGVYQIKENQNQNAIVEEEENSLLPVENIVEPTEMKENEVAQNQETEENTQESTEEVVVEETIEVEANQEETYHFSDEDKLKWPVKGEVLFDYSMDKTVYDPTLEQYRYSKGMAIAGKVNEKVYFSATGKIVDISTNEETGCTVTQEIGNGYVVKYGQLKELNFQVGDIVQEGQVVGFITEPTKYYAVQGSNVYFAVEKDQVPVDPKEYLEGE